MENNIKLDLYKKSYDFIANITSKQERYLEPDELYAAYKSCFGKNQLSENEFFNLYLTMLNIALEQAQHNQDSLEVYYED